MLMYIEKTGLPFQVVYVHRSNQTSQQRLYHLEIGCCFNHIESMLFE